MLWDTPAEGYKARRVTVGREDQMTADFHGAKAAVFIGDDMLIYQRDGRSVWPFYWDFPGGGREDGETPLQCLSREVLEEFGITVEPGDIVWQKSFPSLKDAGQSAWFFVVKKPRDAQDQIRFGSEGLRWCLMPPADVAELPDLVPGLRDRLMLWLRETQAMPI